jgi:peptidoglycan DL-endopeptidase CwlO
MKASFQVIFAFVIIATTLNVQADESTNSKSALATNAATSTATTENDGRVATLAVADLREYDAQPPEVRRLLASALALTTMNLTYKYGSSDPQNGGMDCSGTVYYLLNQAGVPDVPRDSGEMYQWVWTHGHFQAVNSSSADSFEFARLKPGDLLFWTGTYDAKRDPPISHVMIYLGVNRLTGRRVMVGASDGRRFNGKSRYGVSVFDLELPRKRTESDSAPDASATLTARFIGYGSIPSLQPPAP